MNQSTRHKRFIRIICLLFALIFAFSTLASLILAVAYAAG